MVKLYKSYICPIKTPRGETCGKLVKLSERSKHKNWHKVSRIASKTGIDSQIKDVDLLTKLHEKEFLKYSSKSGFFPRWEIRIKRIFNYENFPDWVKNALRVLKRMVGLNRER